MKVTIKVGEVHLITEDLELTRKEVRRLLMDCAGIAASLTPEAEASAPVGFTAHMERLPEDMAGIEYDDED
jgi:hypothetical protein